MALTGVSRRTLAPQDPQAARTLPPELLALLGQQPNNPFGGIPSAPGIQPEHFTGDPSETVPDFPLEVAGLLPPQPGQTFGGTQTGLFGGPGTSLDSFGISQNGQPGPIDIMTLLGMNNQNRPPVSIAGQTGQASQFNPFGGNRGFGGRGGGRGFGGPGSTQSFAQPRGLANFF